MTSYSFIRSSRGQIPGRLSIVCLEPTLRVPLNGDLHSRIGALLEAGHRRIELDLSRLQHLDASGVGELVRAFTAARDAGAVLYITHARGRVRRLLQVSGLLNVLSGAAESSPGERLLAIVPLVAAVGPAFVGRSMV